MNILRNPVLRLNYKQDLDLGGLNTPKPDAVPTILNFDAPQLVQQESKKGPLTAQKRWQDLLHQVGGRPFLFRGYNSIAKKGREI